MKKTSRARSDSAPLGYGFGGLTSWGGAGRPRSGSGLVGRGVPNINRGTVGLNGMLGAMPNLHQNGPDR